MMRDCLLIGSIQEAGEVTIISPPDLLSRAILHLLDCCYFLYNSHEDRHVNLQGLKGKTKEDGGYEKRKTEISDTFVALAYVVIFQRGLFKESQTHSFSEEEEQK